MVTVTAYKKSLKHTRSQAAHNWPTQKQLLASLIDQRLIICTISETQASKLVHISAQLPFTRTCWRQKSLLQRTKLVSQLGTTSNRHNQNTQATRASKNMTAWIKSSSNHPRKNERKTHRDLPTRLQKALVQSPVSHPSGQCHQRRNRSKSAFHWIWCQMLLTRIQVHSRSLKLTPKKHQLREVSLQNPSLGQPLSNLASMTARNETSF